jgi:predicted nucleic acid-binding protein
MCSICSTRTKTDALDANLLLSAAENRSPDDEVAARWLSATLNGHRRVGLPWQSKFLRIATNPRVSRNPLTGPQAFAIVEL